MDPFHLPRFLPPPSAEEEVANLMQQASQSTTLLFSVQLLRSAVDKCKHYGLKAKEASVHCQLSIILLPWSPEDALEEANAAISADPSSGDGYICRSQVFAQLGNIEAHSKCVQDLIRSYELKNESTILLAIKIAVDKDLTDLLSLEQRFSTDECAKITKLMATSEQVPLKYLNYLIMKNEMPGSGVVQTLSCDLSDFPWKKLIKENVLDYDAMKVIVSRGGVFTAQEIYFIIMECGENVKMLEFAMKNCAPKLSHEDLQKFCDQALKLRKFNFIVVLLSHGAVMSPTQIVDKMFKSDIILSKAKIITHLKSSPEGRIELFIKAAKYSEYTFAQSLLGIVKNESLIKKIGLSSVLRCPFKESRIYIAFVKRLLDHGIDLNGDSEANSLDIVLEFPKEYEREKIELLILLLEHDAAIERCTYPRKNRTTLLHIATNFAIDLGTPQAMQLLKEVCKHYPYPEDGKVQDRKGDTPYHMVMERRRSPNTITICEILSQHHINPSVANEHGKKPRQNKLDRRCIIMLEATTKFQAPKKKTKKKRKGKASEAFLSVIADKDKEPAENSMYSPPESTKHARTEDLLDTEDILQDINKTLSQLSNQPQSYFEPPPTYTKQKSLPHPDEAADSQSDLVPETSGKKVEKATVTPNDTQPIARVEVDIENIASNFEGRSWEVECTDKVKKFFANPKVPRSEKEAVVKTVHKLVDGVPTSNHKLCKEVRSDSNIFESRYSKGSRIIFEFAVQFSPRLTSNARNKEYIYSEVIRLWDVVRDHDNLSHHIDHIVQCIKKSHDRGETASIRTPLKMPDKQKQSTQGQAQIRLPQIYVVSESDVKNEKVQTQLINFLPAGSTREDEYNVITFYSFDDSFVKSMLNGENARRDFPFKEWPKEHDIISMPQGKVSILLLGRSGTGKTTCCLYRLWNQFQTYWMGVVDDEPLIPRISLPILENKEETSCEENESEGSKEDCSKPEDDTDEEVDTISNSDVAVQSEHFHQVFITKNYVLCAQMKKRFYDLAAGKDIATRQMKYEDAEIPTSLCEVEDHAYPLFLTARQFFLLLDNSLQDGKNFFQRDEKGQLMEKIISSDYDHEDPDTLLDLEESDSKDEVGDSDFEEYFEPQPGREKKKLQQRREVTASYFAEKIWPKISNKVKLQDTKIDPLLIWMEIKSFIKGSRDAVHNDKGHLTREEYDDLGKKMAPNYVYKRQDIYEIFELYQIHVAHHIAEDVFDECDLNYSIFSRLNSMKDIPWSIHSIYIDEVQDFTQAELSILLRICRNPNDLFLTGDTAQSIMRGIAFRFGDLKSIFYHASKQVPKSVKLEVPQVDELTINFRSHTGVLKLAASIIDLMKAFFPNSFDRLPGDEGMFSGPSPIVLDSCNVSDLALVLRTNKRESSTIEFGAHQVIIVQSEEAKKNIPDVLKAGIVLTVFESKGLEFDDVLLYNFFKDSKVDKDWRVITAFIEDNPEKIVNDVKFSDKFLRRLEFDQNHHKSLNAELKYLYTAITRAKCNLWIYDSDKDKRLPVFDYWHKMGLVKVIRVSDISKDDQGTLFSATSSKEEWKSQGDYFKRKRLWEPAMKCYQKAQCSHLESEARAYSLAQQARTPGLKQKEIEEIYLKSAHAFLKCDQSQHAYKSLENAAKCLQNAKKYEESTQLYLHLGQNNKALKCSKRTNKPETRAMVKDKMDDYDGVIRLLIKHNRVAEALKYAARYEAENRPVSKVHKVHYLASQHAEKLALKLQNETSKEFESVLEYLPPTDRVDHFKSAGMHEKACEVLMEEGKFEELYRIYKAQGWHEEGMQLAKEQGNRKIETDFILLKASSELEGELTVATVGMLKKRIGAGSDAEAKTSLVYGMGTQNHTSVWKAHHYYKTNRISIGRVEALSIAIAMAKYDSKSQDSKNVHEDPLCHILSACKQVGTITDALQVKEPDAVQRQILCEVEDFYGLKKRAVDASYSITPYSFPWTKELLNEHALEDNTKDKDGMLQLKVEAVLNGVCNRLKKIVERWIANDEYNLVDNFHKMLNLHPLHEQMISGGYLTKSLLKSKSLNFQRYFRMLCQAFDIAHYGNTQVISESEVLKALLNTISPQAICYLPISSLMINSEPLIQKLHQKASLVLVKPDNHFVFDKWYEAWRINCVTKKGKQMKEILSRKSANQANKTVDSKVYKRQKSQDQNLPPVYVTDSTGEYKHVMDLWLKTCRLMQYEKKMFASCTIAVHNIIRQIALNKSIWTTVSVSNLLNVVTIHTAAILTMHAACFAYMQPEGNIYMPSSYRNVIEVFQNMNTVPGTRNLDFFRSCMDDVKRSRDLTSLPSKLLNLLTIILKVMIGLLNEAFNPLSYALQNDECLKNHEAHHCLTFVLTLFGNIGLMPHVTDHQLQDYRRKIYDSVKHCTDPALRDAYDRFATSATIEGTFGDIKRLLETSDDDLVCVNIFFNRHNSLQIEFLPAVMTTLR